MLMIKIFHFGFSVLDSTVVLVIMKRLHTNILNRASLPGPRLVGRYNSVVCPNFARGIAMLQHTRTIRPG
jgi:hypothetical protein